MRADLRRSWVAAQSVSLRSLRLRAKESGTADSDKPRRRRLRLRSEGASFDVFRPTISVSKSGDGEGLVTSDPASIDCGSNCSSFDFETDVELTAWPEEGSTFVAWSGACSGLGTCLLTLSEDEQVTAEFDRPTIEHVVGVSLKLKGHLKAVGRISSDFTGCESDAKVKIQRKAGKWKTAKTGFSKLSGEFSIQLPDRSGKYRARLQVRDLGSGDVCRGAVSGVIKYER